MINTPQQHIVPVVPTPEQFRDWVARSIETMGSRPSHYLLDDAMPGSKNRVQNFLSNPGVLKLHMAHELQNQILTDAVRRGVYLQPINITTLSTLLEQRG